MNTDILVVGCGPAGATAAVGLAKLGYQPIVVGRSRGHEVTEGLSSRVLSTLRYCDFASTLETLSSTVPRRSEWNGESVSVNSESLVCRTSFDQALLQDLQRQGICHLDGLIEGLKFDSGQWTCRARLADGQTQQISANYLVDARGRASPLPRTGRVRGPDSVSVYQNWAVASGEPFTTVATTAVGWLWLADDGRGNLYTQLTTDSQSRNFQSKGDIPEAILVQLAEAGIHYPKMNNMTPVGSPGARSSTPIFSGQVISQNCIRIGDAAMAPDPLSGSGVFMALSSALIAPAVINTILQRPEEADLARSFYRDRLSHQFLRLGRMGRDFYQMESRWNSAPFWGNRRQWPDSKLLESSDTVIDVEQRAVVNGGWIECKTVAITEQSPQGIWKVDNRDALRRIREK
ncbi:MAG: tryptophan 7-halogenase [Proteobacteria bacterium]|nr:tryptophan 7-halogenase [Pseudomonadota bacterium]